MDKKNWIFWELLQDKVTIWRLREFERNDLKVSEGGKSIEVVIAIGLNQGGESLKRSTVAVLILSQWINWGWFTLHVEPYVLIRSLEIAVGMWNASCTPNTAICRELHGSCHDGERSGALPVPNSQTPGIEERWPKGRAHMLLLRCQAQSSWAVCVYWVTEPGNSSLLVVTALGGERALPPSPWDGLRARDAPQSLADQINYKL